MSSTTPRDGSASGVHVPDIRAALDIITTDMAIADTGPPPSLPTRHRFPADWWRTRFTTATDSPLEVAPNMDTATTSAGFPTPPPPEYPAMPLPLPPPLPSPLRSVPMIRRDGGSGGRTRPFSVPATADLLGTGRTSFEIASPASAHMRVSSRRLFRPHSVDELWGPPVGTSHDTMPAFQHRLQRHQSGHLRDWFMTNQTVGSGGSDVVAGGGSVPSAFVPAIPLQRFHTHTQPIDLPFDRTETMDTNDFRSSWFFGSGGRRRRDDADREGDEGDDDHDDADEEAEDETDAHVGASTSDSEGAGLHRSRAPRAGSTNAGTTQRPSLMHMRHEQRRMRREEHDRSTMSDLGLSADFQDHVTKYRRTWRANWPTRRTSAMNTESLQSINPARYVYERRHRKARQSPLERIGGHLWPVLTVGRYFDCVRKSKSLRESLILLHLVTDLALVVLYLFEMAALFRTLDTKVPMPGFHPPWLWIPRPFPIYVVGMALAMIDLVAFIARLAISDDLLRTLLSWDTPVDLLTTVPFIVSIFLHNGPLLYIPYYLRSIPCISRLRRFLRIRLELSNTIEAVDVLREKLTALVATIVVIIYVTMCAFQYTGAMFGNQTLSIIDSVYVTVVTLTTVGYGDMTPKSWQGKLVVVVAILVSFVFVPGLVSSAVATWKVWRDGGGTFSKRKRIQHVVLIGRFEDPRLVSSLLQALFHSETSKPLKVVFLCRRRPPTTVKALINAPLFRDRVFYIQGSALNDSDMQRAQIATADAVFFISNNTTAEDERNVLRVWSVVRHAPLTHLYIYTHRPEYERYHTVHSTAVVCADEMKQSLLGSNCIHRGVATLIINLISTTTPEDHYEVPWMAQYGDGMGHEIYNLHVPELFRGCQFHHIAAYLFLEFQVVVIAVRIPVLHRTAEFETIDYHVILNPGAEYVLRGNEELVCIAQGLHEIHLIQAMSAEQFERSLHNHPPIFTTVPSGAPASRFTLGRRPTTTSIVPPEALLHSLPKLLGTPYLIDQPEAPFTDSRKVSLCHLLRTPPARVSDAVLDDARDLSGHILVITPSWYLFRFLTTVRAAHIPAEDLRPILFMSPNLPSHDEFRVLAPFPLVHYLQGNPRRRKDLLRANVTAADRVVILSDLERSAAPSSPGGNGRGAGKTDENGGGGDDFVDLGPILTRHLVAHVAARPPAAPGAAPDSPGTLARRGNMYTMVELSDSNAIKYLDPSSDMAGVAGAHQYKLHPLQATPWTLPTGPLLDGKPRSVPTNGVPPTHAMLSSATAAPAAPTLAPYRTASPVVSQLFAPPPPGLPERGLSSTSIDDASMHVAPPTLLGEARRRLRRRITVTDSASAAAVSAAAVSAASIRTGAGGPGSESRAASTENLLTNMGAAFALPRSGHNPMPVPPVRGSPSKEQVKLQHVAPPPTPGIPPRWQMFYAPQFASGEAFCSDLLDTILIQHYYNPVILDVVKLFAGVRTRTHLRLDRELGLLPSFLYTIDVSTEYVGLPFKTIFVDLCLQHGVIAVGLYRAPCKTLGNSASFVYTAPHPEVVLKDSDVLYVLSKVWRGSGEASKQGGDGGVEAGEEMREGAGVTSRSPS